MADPGREERHRHWRAPHRRNGTLKQEEKEDIIIEESLSLIMVGDCLIHGAIYDDARENGTFNFDKMFEVLSVEASS